VKLSIYTRLVLWITLLLCVLFGAVLFVIRSREVSTLFAQTQTQALIIARYMADVNRQPLVRYDEAAIQSYVDEQAGEALPYIVFYDRLGAPLVASELAASRADLLDRSHFDDDVGPEARFSAARRIRVENRWLRVLEVEIPIFLPGADRRWASVKIGHSLEPMYADVRQIQAALLLVGLGGFGIGILGASLLAKKITRPINKLVDGTVRISRGDFSHSIDIFSRDEIGGLARSFNEMTVELLQTRERMEEANRRLVQAEKLASIGRLAATIAHEIRNPLTSVKLNVQKIAEEENRPAAEMEHLALSMEGIGQIEKFIKELLNYTRVAELALERFPPAQILDESLKTLKETFAQKAIVLEKSIAENVPAVVVDADKIRQVFLNILRNAQEAMEPGGRISVSLDTVESGGRTDVRVRISDSGPGIPEKDRENIFEPFFTTKPSGFGLGLANARKILEQHNGSIRLGRKRGRGSVFIILIPAEEEP
jgi:signal transduction histidine kinase